MSDVHHGRNRISPRAIRSVVSAITAAELHTSARAVGVELADDDGALAVTVSAPVAIASLVGPTGRVRPAPASASRAASASTSAPAATVLDRASAAQHTIRTRVLELTGSAVATVNLRLTTARIATDERVR